MKEFTAPSGAKIVINLAPWKEAKLLKAAAQKAAAAKSSINLEAGADASSLISAILLIDSSPEVDAALWPCLARCTRNGEKIVESAFDDGEARKDYYNIVISCMEENFGPLAESALSRLPEGFLVRKS